MSKDAPVPKRADSLRDPVIADLSSELAGIPLDLEVGVGMSAGGVGVGFVRHCLVDFDFSKSDEKYRGEI